MRLFVGLPLSTEARAELQHIVARLKPTLDSWRWTAPDSWHITLQFLGNTTPSQYQQLIAQLHTIHSPAVPIQLGALDLFDRVGVFFADVVVSPELLALQKKVVSATASCSFVAESRPYRPHITLARLKSGEHNRTLRSLRAKLPAQRFSGFVANEFLLYESFSRPRRIALPGARPSSPSLYLRKAHHKPVTVLTNRKANGCIEFPHWGGPEKRSASHSTALRSVRGKIPS